MRFLKPTLDIAFKKLFGSQERTGLTISFLNSVLERQEGELITELTINDSANRPVTRDKESTFVDVSCTDQTGKKYIIEMQVVDEKNFIERSQFYTAFFLARQLEKKDSYTSLVPVIFVGVVCFNLFENPDYLSHHYIVDARTGKRTLRHLEFHFIELPKFEKKLEEVTTVTEKWAYLIKHAHEMEQIPRMYQGNHEMVAALNVLEQHNWTEDELQAYFAELDAWRGKLDMKKAARAEGEIEGKIKTAANLLAMGMEIEQVIKATELSADQVGELQIKYSRDK